MSHTKEPWAQHADEPSAIVAKANEHLSLLTTDADGVAVFYRVKDARRAVACVNACAGIATEGLERGTPIIAANQLLASLGDEYKKQRDELLTICRNVVERGIGASDIRAMKEAIAKVEAQ